MFFLFFQTSSDIPTNLITLELWHFILLILVPFALTSLAVFSYHRLMNPLKGLGKVVKSHTFSTKNLNMINDNIEKLADSITGLKDDQANLTSAISNLDGMLTSEKSLLNPLLEELNKSVSAAHDKYNDLLKNLDDVEKRVSNLTLGSKQNKNTEKSKSNSTKKNK